MCYTNSSTSLFLQLHLRLPFMLFSSCFFIFFINSSNNGERYIYFENDSPELFIHSFYLYYFNNKKKRDLEKKSFINPWGFPSMRMNKFFFFFFYHHKNENEINFCLYIKVKMNDINHFHLHLSLSLSRYLFVCISVSVSHVKVFSHLISSELASPANTPASLTYVSFCCRMHEWNVSLYNKSYIQWEDVLLTLHRIQCVFLIICFTSTRRHMLDYEKFIMRYRNHHIRP